MTWLCEERRVPSIDEPVLVGVDEAGRGPVLGPMVYAAFIAPISNAHGLSSFHFADSKVLSAEKRDELFDKIVQEKEFGWVIRELSAECISNCMLRKEKYNLNDLSHDTVIEMIREISLQRKIEQVWIDTVGPPEKYQKKMESFFPSIKFCVSKKADSLYPAVSAASILAKVTRDHILSTLPQLRATGEIGSGYPGDPNTIAWLNRNFNAIFGFPSAARFSWSTVERMIQDKGVQVTWEAALQFKRKSDKSLIESMGLERSF